MLKVFCSLLSDQLAQPKGTVDVPWLFVLLKVTQFRNEATGEVLRLDLGLQRLLHPSRALESACRMGGEVSSFVFVTLG